ncbi:MAG: DUF2254 family protein [Actinomycetes bacterium]
MRPSPDGIPQRDPRAVAARGRRPGDVRRGEFGEAVRLSFTEFLTGALLCAAGVLVVGGAVYLLDRSTPGFLGPLHRRLGAFFGTADAVSQLLQTIASTVITVASITFSLLLVAVQQSASSFTAQAFDQFLRRRLNQFYMGFFVGLGAYALLQASTVHEKFVPVYGSTLAVLLSVVAVGMLLLLVYTTINQMRPVVIVEAIHDHLVEARGRLLREVVGRTRRTPQLESEQCTPVFSAATGFVVRIDLDRIQKEIDRVSGECEVVLDVSIGDFIAYGDRLARINTACGDGDEAVVGRVARAVERGVHRERQRNIDSVDAAYGLQQLETVGWTSISGANHNPRAARVVVAQLRDVLARAAAEDDDVPPSSGADTAIVYRDNVPEVLLSSIESLAVITADSQQHQVAADIVDAFAGLLEVLPDVYRQRSLQVLLRTLPALASHPPTLLLESALTALVDALECAGEPDAADVVRRGLENLRKRIGAVDVEYTPR